MDVFLKLKNVRVLLSLVFIVFFAACASLPPTEPDWSFGQNAIQISFAADDLINVYKNAPHTVALVVYQLSETNAFEDLTKYEEGLKTLLRNENFDPSVKARRRFIINPGDRSSFVLDRAENAKWVGLVAGYYGLNPGKVSNVFAIPVVVEETGIIKEKKTSRVRDVHVYIIFGRHGIEEVEVR